MLGITPTTSYVLTIKTLPSQGPPKYLGSRRCKKNPWDGTMARNDPLILVEDGACCHQMSLPRPTNFWRNHPAIPIIAIGLAEMDKCACYIFFSELPFGYGSKLTRRGYADFGPCFHLPGQPILVPTNSRGSNSKTVTPKQLAWSTPLKLGNPPSGASTNSLSSEVNLQIGSLELSLAALLDWAVRCLIP